MDVVAKKHPTDGLLYLSSVAANMNTNFLNRCRMNAIQGKLTSMMLFAVLLDSGVFVGSTVRHLATFDAIVIFFFSVISVTDED